MSFANQAMLATVVVAGCVAGLVVLGRGASDEPAEATEASAQAPKTAPSVSPQPAPVKKGVTVHPVRNLVPKNAWLVADFQGDLTGQKPFADQPGMCAETPAPKRVAMAVLPPVQGTEPDLLIAAQQVEDVFWGCARDRIVRAGGTALTQNERYEVLKSPSGVVARGPHGSMVFLTGEGHLEAALSVLSDLTPGAAGAGPHADLYQRIYSASGDPRDSVLDITLALPESWLDAVGQQKEETPLRFIRAAFVSAHADGSAQGGVDCEEAGCGEVLAFLQRAQADLLKNAPPNISQAVSSSLTSEHVKGAGRITINWQPSQVPLVSLLGRFLGPGLGP